MKDQVIKFEALNQSLRKTGGFSTYPSDTVEIITAEFELGDEWDGYDSVRAVWQNGEVKISSFLDSNYKCKIPSEVLENKGTLEVNLVASSIDDDVLTERLTSYKVVAFQIPVKVNIDGSDPQDVTPSQFEQFVAVVKEDADRAEAGATDAEASAQSASGSATASAESAESASTSAQNAEQSATSAGTHATNAQTSATTASQKAAQAAASEANAQTYAEQAQESAESAEASATSAGEFAESASASSESASASKTAAEAARQQAYESAQSSQTCSEQSQGYASQAAASATSASQSATAASASATSASQSAQTATTKASEASASATTATAKASEASASATAAQTAQAGAETAQAGAETAAQTAQAGANAVGLLREQIYNSYPNVEAEAGPIVSISDGADGIPVKSLVVGIEPVQEGTGDPSPDNVRPISGFDSVKVTRTGKNLLDVDKYGDKLPRTKNGITWSKVGEGVYHVSGTATARSYFDVSFSTNLASAMPAVGFHGKSLYLSTTNSGISVLFGYFREDGSYSNLQNGKVLPVEAVALRAYLIIDVGATIDTDFNIQLEIGSTATDYEPYAGNTYDITLPTEAGTVYGGSLDVTTGVLTVDKAMVDLGTLNWKYFQNSAKTKYYFRTVNEITNVKPSYGNIPNCISNRYKTASWAATVDDATTNNCITIGWVGKSYTAICDSAYSDAVAFKTAMSGVQLVYELATPITYRLTPQEITTLLGQNNIWADTGDTSVTYRADTKLYIQNLTKPTEDDMTANAAITSGKFFMINNRLFLATAAIASGTMIIPGTNCSELSLADALNNINS